MAGPLFKSRQRPCAVQCDCVCLLAGSDAHLLPCISHMCPLQHRLALVQVMSFPGCCLLSARRHCRLCSTSVRMSPICFVHHFALFIALCRQVWFGAFSLVLCACRTHILYSALLARIASGFITETTSITNGSYCSFYLQKLFDCLFWVTLYFRLG